MHAVSTKRSLVTSAAIIGISALVFAIAAYLLMSKLENNANQVVLARTSIDRGARVTTRIAALKEQAELAARYDRVIGILLPTQEALLDAPREIATLAATMNVNAALQFGDTNANSVSYSLSADGSQENLIQFLRAFELTHPKYLVSVEGVDVAKFDAGYRMVTNGEIFFQP